MTKVNRYTKPGGDWVSPDYVERKEAQYASLPYPLPKYVQFIKRALGAGLRVRLYDCPSTVSKYVTIIHHGKRFKIRFSNHKPIFSREMKGDCDFFVGVTHTGVKTTDDAWTAMVKAFQVTKGDSNDRNE